MSLLDALREAGSAIGGAGGTAVLYIFKRFRALEKRAALALKIASEGKEQIDKLFTLIEKLSNELKDLSDEPKVLEDPRASMASISEQKTTVQRIDDLTERFKELREDVIRDRGARHALQKDFVEYTRGEAESWSELQRTLGQLEGLMQGLKTKS